MPNEEFLIENGHQEAVASVRDQFQSAIGSTFRGPSNDLPGGG